MDQVKIGKFIADCRKERGLTQELLEEKLGVTSKSISRWENGSTMPDYSLLKDLCININELLSGERIKKSDYMTEAEKNFINLKKRVDKTSKFLNILCYASIVLMIIVWGVCKYLNKYYGGTYSSEELRLFLVFFISFCSSLSAVLGYKAKK